MPLTFLPSAARLAASSRLDHQRIYLIPYTLYFVLCTLYFVLCTLYFILSVPSAARLGAEVGLLPLGASIGELHVVVEQSVKGEGVGGCADGASRALRVATPSTRGGGCAQSR